jgi:hypothetical protein
MSSSAVYSPPPAENAVVLRAATTTAAAPPAVKIDTTATRASLPTDSPPLAMVDRLTASTDARPVSPDALRTSGSPSQPRRFSKPNRQADLREELKKLHYMRLDSAKVTIYREERLGEGGFGVVYQGKYCTLDVAVKCIGVGRAMSDVSLLSLFKEAEVHYKLRSNYIVQLHGIWIDEEAQPATPCLVLELMESSLYDAIKSAEWVSVTVEEKLTGLINIAQGMQYLHAMGIMHRDVKSLNVLVGQGYANWKLSDFGFTETKRSLDTLSSLPVAGSSIALKQHAPVGTYAWMAPGLSLMRCFVKNECFVD